MSVFVVRCPCVCLCVCLWWLLSWWLLVAVVLCVYVCVSFVCVLTKKHTYPHSYPIYLNSLSAPHLRPARLTLRHRFPSTYTQTHSAHCDTSGPHCGPVPATPPHSATHTVLTVCRRGLHLMSHVLSGPLSHKQHTHTHTLSLTPLQIHLWNLTNLHKKTPRRDKKLQNNNKKPLMNKLRLNTTVRASMWAFSQALFSFSRPIVLLS